MLHRVKKEKMLLLMLAVPVLWYITFSYIPMVGVLISFQDFNLFKGIFHSDWIGLYNYHKLFTDHYFWKVFRNTIILGSLTMLFTFPAPILLAILLNEIKDGAFKKMTQTISYLPFFVSLVALVNIVVIMLSPSGGIVNSLIKDFGGVPINFMIENAWFRPIYIVISLWQSTGWLSIIYLAAMSGIDPQLYQAAEVDGASRMRKIWHISLPGIAPTIVILLLLNLPNLIQTNFEMVLLLQKPLTFEASDVVQTYVYRRGILNGDFGLATAVGNVFSVVSLIIIYSSNRLARKFGETSLW